ncbi:MAG: hypothetical protein ACRDRL_11185 [Sciscionella sp.]
MITPITPLERLDNGIGVYSGATVFLVKDDGLPGSVALADRKNGSSLISVGRFG